MDGVQPGDIPAQFKIQHLSPIDDNINTNADDNIELSWSVEIPETVSNKNNLNGVIGPEELNCGCFVPTRLQESCGIAEYNGTKIIVNRDGSGGGPKPTVQKSNSLQLGSGELTTSIQRPSNGFRSGNITGGGGLLTTKHTNASRCVSGVCSDTELSYSICRSHYSLDSMGIIEDNVEAPSNLDPSFIIDKLGDDRKFKRREVLEPGTLRSPRAALEDDQTTAEFLKRFRAKKTRSRTLEQFMPLGKKGPVFVLKKGLVALSTVLFDSLVQESFL